MSWSKSKILSFPVTLFTPEIYFCYDRKVSINGEIIKPALETMEWGFNPLPEETLNLPPDQMQVHDIFYPLSGFLKERMLPQAQTATLDRSGVWQNIPVSEVDREVWTYLSYLYDQTHNINVSCDLTGLQVATFGPLSLHPYRRLYKVEAKLLHILGDGTAIYNPESGIWEFTQRKGLYPSSSRIVFQQF